MSPLVAAVLGLVEGLTEYLPVSSTGHLILVGHWLGSDGEAAKSFDIVIQLGAILAVVVHYRTLLWARITGLARRDQASLDLATALAIGFVPAAVVGFALHSAIKRLLFGPLPVAIALLVGGALMIAIERHRERQADHGLIGLEHVTPRRALLVGLGQCLSLCPGASRSMCTIVAGQFAGFSTATAAEFSFLLALPTLGAATVYELYKGRHTLLAEGVGADLAIGLGVSFLVAWAVIAGFIRYLKNRGLAPFGYYRIALGVSVLWMIFR